MSTRSTSIRPILFSSGRSGLARVAFVITALCAAACSSGSGSTIGDGATTDGGAGAGAGASGVDSTKSLTQLSSAEIATYCDWEIQMGGGEGHVTNCGNSTSVQTPTKADCKSGISALAGKSACANLTVGRAEACIVAEEKDRCGEPAACKEVNDAAEACLGK